MLNQVALVSESKSVSLAALNLVSAAIQKQVARDLAPSWNLEASVDAFDNLEDVPLGYWQVIIMDDIPYNAGGIHLNRDNGQPFALVRFSEDWSLTVSHEVLEMLVDPSGNRTVATNSPDPKQGRVLVLVEISDPSEAAEFGYTINGILVSDFYTPRFFDPVASDGVQYSFTGAIKAPRQVLEGGYISWWDPETTHVFQLFVENGAPRFDDLGTLPAGFETLRSFADRKTNDLRKNLKKTAPTGARLTGALGLRNKPNKIDDSTKACASSLRKQIDYVLKQRS